MRALRHYNVIQLYEVHETESTIYLVLDLVQGKLLEEILSSSSFKQLYAEEQIIHIFHSILDTLMYMASKGIMHRDLKPENIIVERNGRIRIVDFSLSTYINVSNYIIKRCGSPGYIAPEVFVYDPKIPSTNYNDRCDVFSAGCIFYYL